MSSQDDSHQYLIDSGWIAITNPQRTMYKDPKTKRLFPRQFAEIVQQGYDEEELEKLRARTFAKDQKDFAKLQRWMKTEHTPDEVYPPGSVWDERDLPKGQQVFRGTNVEFKFGKHKGKTLVKVLNEHPDYVLWLDSQKIASFSKSALKTARENSSEECYKLKVGRPRSK